VDKRKRSRSLGRDVFEKSNAADKSDTLKRLLENNRSQAPAEAKQVEVRVKLTPSNIKHLDALRAALEKEGKGRFTRNELIRVAITLLSSGDF
jgi:hypothetical protein